MMKLRSLGRLLSLCLLGLILAGLAGQLWAGQAAALSVTAEVARPDADPATDSPLTAELLPAASPTAAPASAGNAPRVLIYHTHTHEAYTKGDQPYRETEKWRTADEAYNVVRVGTELATCLEEEYGIAVLHDRTDHEPPKLGTAYSRSLKTLEKAAEQYPSLEILIDLHRDAYSRGLKKTVTLAGQPAAQLMVVIGTGEKGFSVKPDWEKNLALAEKLTQKLNAIQPELAREVRVKTGRYNQHIAPGCILIEAGHNENTLEEVLRTVPYLARVLAEILGQEAGTGA